MTRETEKENSLLSAVLEVITRDGSEGMSEVFRVLLNEAMKAERSAVINAQPYERSEDRLGYANGYKPKTLNTRMGSITVEIPQARGISFYPRSLERGCRSEKALKLAIAEMYVTGVSTRRVTEITEQLCGLDISSTQVSRIAATLDQELEKFRNRPLSCYPYMLLDARYEKIRHDGRVIDAAVLVAIGVNTEGRREILGVSVKISEAETHWREFLQTLKARGLHGLELLVSDDHSGLKAARKAVFPAVPWQRCQFHFAQNAQAYVPKRSMRDEIAQAVRDIFNASSKQEALDQTARVAQNYKVSAPEFANWLEQNIEDCLQVFNLPIDFQTRLRTVNALELLNREIKRRTLVARIFPNTDSLLRLVTAILVEVHDGWVSSPMPYLNLKIRSQQKPGATNSQIYRKNVA